MRMFSWRSTKRAVARSKTCWRGIEGLQPKSKPSRGFSRSKLARPEGELLLGPALDFVFQEPLEKLDKRELLLHRLAIAELQGFEDPRESEALELGDELMGEGHGHASRTKKSVQGRANCAAGPGGGSGWAKTSASSPCWRIRLITP